MTRAKTRKRPPARPRPTVARRRENTSAIVMMPYEVAEQLLISEREAYTLMALGPARGGVRCMNLGSESSSRPRKVIHRKDFELYVEYKRNLLSLDQYLEALKKR